MQDYVAEIADLLRAGQKVIIYTVGSATFEYIRELKARFKLTPTAICDGDPKKQGRTYKGLDGLIVLAPQEALNCFPEGKIFISSLDYKYQIIGYLTEDCGVKPQRIINYCSVKKIRSCSFLQKALIYSMNGAMRFCWRKPCPAIDSQQEGLNAHKWLNLRNSLIEAIKEGRAGHPACAGCPQISENYYPSSPLSWSINYFCQSVCNYKCSYCAVAHVPPPDYDVGRHSLGQVLAAVKGANMLSPSYSVILSTAGEPLLHPQRKAFYAAFDGAEFIINTNGSLFDPDLLALMNKKRVLLLCSVDAGTPETYNCIKGLKRPDALSKVRNNLACYAQATIGLTALKYIFIPQLNDNKKDIDGFIELVDSVNAFFVVVALDYFSAGNINGQTKDMIQYLSQSLRQKDILCVPYTAGESCGYSKTLRELMV